MCFILPNYKKPNHYLDNKSEVLEWKKSIKQSKNTELDNLCMEVNLPISGHNTKIKFTHKCTLKVVDND